MMAGYLALGSEAMDGWMGGWVDRWVGGWMDGWMDGFRVEGKPQVSFNS